MEFGTPILQKHTNETTDINLEVAMSRTTFPLPEGQIYGFLSGVHIVGKTWSSNPKINKKNNTIEQIDKASDTCVIHILFKDPETGEDRTHVMAGEQRFELGKPQGKIMFAANGDKAYTDASIMGLIGKPIVLETIAKTDQKTKRPLLDDNNNIITVIEKARAADSDQGDTIEQFPDLESNTMSSFYNITDDDAELTAATKIGGYTLHFAAEGIHTNPESQAERLAPWELATKTEAFGNKISPDIQEWILKSREEEVEYLALDAPKRDLYRKELVTKHKAKQDAAKAGAST